MSNLTDYSLKALVPGPEGKSRQGRSRYGGGFLCTEGQQHPVDDSGPMAPLIQVELPGSELLVSVYISRLFKVDDVSGSPGFLVIEHEGGQLRPVPDEPDIFRESSRMFDWIEVEDYPDDTNWPDEFADVDFDERDRLYACHPGIKIGGWPFSPNDYPVTYPMSDDAYFAQVPLIWPSSFSRSAAGYLFIWKPTAESTWRARWEE